MKSVDELCIYLKISKQQRKTELYNNQGLKGTQGYENIGCYKCDGYKFECSSYNSNKEVYGVKKEWN